MNLEPNGWYARRWVRALCGVVGIGLLLFSVTGPLTLTFLSVTSLGCLPGTACETWSVITLPLGGICALFAIAGGVCGTVQAIRPRRGLVMAQILLTIGTALTMVALIIAAQAASVGRAQVASAQQVADSIVTAGDAALRQNLGFNPIGESDPKRLLTATGPDQQFLGCTLESAQAPGYQVQVTYRFTGLDDERGALLAGIPSLSLPSLSPPGAASAVTSLINNGDGSALWKLSSSCLELPQG